MAHRDIIVIGASAGGVEALQVLTAALPRDLRAAVFVTLHFPEHATSVLPRIIDRSSKLRAAHAVDGEPIAPGRIYIAPPDVHLLITRRAVRLARGAKESGNRPAIDPMFRSAALAFGPRVIGVVLTGNLDDGTSGLRAIKRAAGAAVVQDPADAVFPSMPRSAIQHAPIDRVVSLREIAPTIVELMAEGVPDGEHALMTDDVSEHTMWMALRVLEESADLARQIAARHRARGAEDLAKRFEERAESRERRAAVIRASIVERTAPTDVGESGPRRAS